MARGRLALMLLFMLLRVCVLAGAFQLTGFAHIACDAVEMLTSGHHPQEQDDCDEHDCPPGCPSCHRSHGGATPFLPSPPSLTALLETSEILPGVAAESPPPDRSLAPPDRPPRV